jgi:hypothetical protein
MIPFVFQTVQSFYHTLFQEVRLLKYNTFRHKKICLIPAAAGSADLFGRLFLFVGDHGVTARTQSLVHFRITESVTYDFAAFQLFLFHFANPPG